MPLPPRVFCDTSFFYATIDDTDRDYDRAGELLAESTEGGTRLLSTWDVVSETITLLRYRMNFAAATYFLTEIKPTLNLIMYGDAVRAEAERVFRQRAPTRRLSFCDAISFVVVTTMLDHIPCAAFDDDFRALGLTVVS